MSDKKPWKCLNREVVVDSKWVKVYKDHLLDDDGEELEYWHVGRSDSVLVLVRQGENFLLPAAQWRPGVEQRTLDFPGGRVDDNEPEVAAMRIVQRELGLDASVVLRLETLTPQPLLVDSSFSSQKLHGYVVELPSELTVNAQKFNADQLLAELRCLQCRALLLELLYRRA
jgi:8-oxo-dGTP pyrophosphatase MutT (NUDIX family)